MKKKSSVLELKPFLRIGKVFFSVPGIILLSVLVALSIFALVALITNNSQTPSETTTFDIEDNNIETFQIESSLYPQPEIQEGDIIQFGTYEQDGNSSNGKECIEWIVLTVEDGSAFLISKYCLARKQYNEKLATVNKIEEVTWETCTLRKWLNSTFYNESFSDEEKEQIIPSVLDNNENPVWNTSGGNSTTDNVFLVSIDELDEYFDIDYTTDSNRQGIRFDYEYTKKYYREDWWLRSPGSNATKASYVDYNCFVFENGCDTNINLFVRPALWIKLNS